MKTIDSFSNTEGKILRLIEYENYLERIKNGGRFAIEYISNGKATKEMYDYYGSAKAQFCLLEHRDLLTKVCNHLKRSNLFSYYEDCNEYCEIIRFLKYCCDFKNIDHPETFGINPVQVINFVKKNHIDEKTLAMVGKFREYATIKESTNIDLCIETNPFDGSIINCIIINIGINSNSKRIFYLDDSMNNPNNISDTTRFMYCYAANMHYHI